MERFRDYYAILGVSRNTTTEQIKEAYRRLVKKYHPDRHPSPEAEEMLKLINEAYHVLSDPVRRAEYDALYDTIISKTSMHVAVETKESKSEARKSYMVYESYAFVRSLAWVRMLGGLGSLFMVPFLLFSTLLMFSFLLSVDESFRRIIELMAVASLFFYMAGIFKVAFAYGRIFNKIDKEVAETLPIGILAIYFPVFFFFIISVANTSFPISLRFDTGLTIVLIIDWAILCYWARAFRDVCKTIVVLTGIEMFRKVGRLYYYGALLLFVFVGTTILLIAHILQMLAFFSLPSSVTSVHGQEVMH